MYSDEIEEIRHFISSQFLGGEPIDVPITESLTARGILTSLRMVLLSDFLFERFGVDFPADLVGVSSIQEIVDIVDEVRQSDAVSDR